MKIRNHLKGVVSFRAYGGYFESYINAAVAEHKKLWKIYKSDGVFYGYTYAKQYPRLARLAKKYGVRLRVNHRHGIPFLINRYRKRAGLLIGFLVFICFLYTMQNFIWKIEVVGNQNIKAELILEKAKNSGLYRGAFLKNLDLKGVKKELEYQLPDIAWMTLNRTGSRVVIEIKETTQKPDITIETPCNLIAKKDGIIKYMEVYNGEKAVQIKDVVNKGDLLVSGVVEDKFQQTRFLSASGKIIAETYDEVVFEQPLNIEKKEYTGVVKTRNCLNLFGFRMPLYIAVHLDGSYEKILENHQLKIMGNELPIGIDKTILKEYRIVKQQYQEKEAYELLEKKAVNYEKSIDKEVKILSKEMNKNTVEGICKLTISYTFEEDIAQKEKIEITD